MNYAMIVLKYSPGEAPYWLSVTHTTLFHHKPFWMINWNFKYWARQTDRQRKDMKLYVHEIACLKSSLMPISAMPGTCYPYLRCTTSNISDLLLKSLLQFSYISYKHNVLIFILLTCYMCASEKWMGFRREIVCMEYDTFLYWWTNVRI